MTWLNKSNLYRIRRQLRLIPALIMCLLPAGFSTISAQETSVPGNTAVEMTVYNTCDNPFDLYWVDFDGNPQYYMTVEPGKEFVQQSYAGHTWVAVEGGQERYRMTTTSEPKQAFGCAADQGETTMMPEEEDGGVEYQSGPTNRLTEFVWQPDYMQVNPHPSGLTIPYAPVNVWSREVVYDLTRGDLFTIQFEALLTNEGQELIFAFSSNRIPWDSPGADALTIRVTPQEADVWWRTGFYENWLDYDLYLTENERAVVCNKWQRYQIDISAEEANLFIDNRPVASASLGETSFPQAGYFGLIVFGNEQLTGTQVAYQNINYWQSTLIQDVADNAVAQGGSVATADNTPTPETVKPVTDTATRGAETVLLSEKPDGTTDEGRFFALLIGVQEYKHKSLKSLDFPVQDARKFRMILTQEYTFEDKDVISLNNPTRSQIVETLDSLKTVITEKDNLLIFYAGHGYWDDRMQQGFWLPSDAKQSSRANWISNGTLRDYINGIKTRHTLVISDACFSGSMFKTRAAFADADKSTKELYKYPSRKAMTSGALKEVPDKSVFLEFLVKRLKENESRYLPAQTLFTQLREPVANNSPVEQSPQFGVIRETGDETGEFIFVKRQNQ